MSDLYDKDFYDDKALTLSQPLTHCRIGWQNLASAGSIAASSAAAGFPVTSLQNALTYEFWKPASFPASVVVDLLRPQPVDYLGLAAHELAGCTVVLESGTDGTTYTEVTRARLTNDESVMLLFTEVTARYWRLTLTGYAVDESMSANFSDQYYETIAYDGASTGGASLSVLYLGKALAVQRMIYGGHTPGPMSRVTKTTTNMSEGGQWLGRSIIRGELTTNVALNNLRADWYRQNFDPFAESARANPYFFAWRPSSFADEVVYGQTPDSIAPDNAGTRDFMTVSFPIIGYSQ